MVTCTKTIRKLCNSIKSIITIFEILLQVMNQMNVNLLFPLAISKQKKSDFCEWFDIDNKKLLQFNVSYQFQRTFYVASYGINHRAFYNHFETNIKRIKPFQWVKLSSNNKNGPPSNQQQLEIRKSKKTRTIYRSVCIH